MWLLFPIRVTRVELSYVHFGQCKLLTARCVTLVLTNIGAIICFLFPSFSSFSLRLSLCDWGFAQSRMHPPYCLCVVILLITPNKSRRMWLLFLTGFASSYVPNEGFYSSATKLNWSKKLVLNASHSIAVFWGLAVVVLPNSSNEFFSWKFWGTKLLRSLWRR